MSHKFVSALIVMAAFAVCVPALAQDKEPEHSFKLLRDSATAAAELELEEELQARWEPAITGGSVEVSFFLGFLNLKADLLSHNQIIYKYTDEATFWGDMTIKGDRAFNPGLRIGYNLNKWFSLEGVTTVSFSEYSSSVTDRKRRSNESGSSVDLQEPALGEFDLESRSLITGSAGINALVYPLNVSGDGKGRLHPFITGGIAAMWYDMNSDYTEGPAGTVDLSIGGGLRLLADRNISLRIEAMFHRHTIEFTPTTYFRKLNEGTTLIPLNEYPIEGDRFTEKQVSAFDSVTINSLNYSIGVQGSF